MKIFSRSDKGTVRVENQDRIWTGAFGDNNEAAVIILCDGMGGEKAGSVASQTSVDFIRERIQKGYRENITRNQLRNLLITSVTAANSVVYNMAVSDEEKAGMGTTCVVAIILNERAYIVNIGDSRAYRIFDDNMQQITKDHTFIRKLIEKGQITEEESKTHPKRNCITKAIGAQNKITPDYFELDLNKDDLLLFCSDGLSSYAEDEEIAEIIVNNNISKVCDLLIDLVNSNGGRDNVTVALVSI